MEHLAKVLVVDDDRDLATLLCMILEKASYDVREAHNAPDAFEKVVQWRPDLVLLDVMMPDGAEGLHLVRRIRDQLEPPASETPIIILSVIHAVTELCPDSAFDGQELGPEESLPVQAFLDKPTTPEALLREVRANTSRQAPVS